MRAAQDEGPAAPSALAASADDRRYAAWFHELDAWTEYWDVYQPQTRGRYYFGDGAGEAGLLSLFLPRTAYPPPWTAWSAWALGAGGRDGFERAVRQGEVAAAVLEVDALVGRLFARHFGEADDPAVQADYLEATLRFALDALPAASERDARIPEGDWRKPTAGRHTLDGDLMWFAWALHTEAADILAGGARDLAGRARRALMLAGVAAGCPANFAWRGHRRTRAEYQAGPATLERLRARAREWSGDLDAAADEIRQLYRIREWGEAG